MVPGDMAPIFGLEIIGEKQVTLLVIYITWSKDTDRE